jgi:hypothetical protein
MSHPAPAAHDQDGRRKVPAGMGPTREKGPRNRICRHEVFYRGIRK